MDLNHLARCCTLGQELTENGADYLNEIILHYVDKCATYVIELLGTKKVVTATIMSNACQKVDDNPNNLGKGKYMQRFYNDGEGKYKTLKRCPSSLPLLKVKEIFLSTSNLESRYVRNDAIAFLAGILADILMDITEHEPKICDYSKLKDIVSTKFPQFAPEPSIKNANS